MDSAPSFTPPPPMPMDNGINNQMGDATMGGDNEMDDENDFNDSEGGPGKDVKKYSGELSQALNSYNNENPNDDEKINKYAINMIAAQVADYLSDKDKRNVIKKLRGDSDDMSSDEQNDIDKADKMQQMESRIVSEILNEPMNDKKAIKRPEKKITNKKVVKGSPFAR